MNAICWSTIHSEKDRFGDSDSFYGFLVLKLLYGKTKVVSIMVIILACSYFTLISFTCFSFRHT